jgi:hypothetical protein
LPCLKKPDKKAPPKAASLFAEGRKSLLTIKWICPIHAEPLQGDHASIKDGGDPTFAYCLNCSEEYYNTNEEVCVKCGAKGPYRCSFCAALIPIGELSVDDGDLCGYCHDKLNKDD